MNTTLFTNMMSIDRVISIYLFFLSGGITTLVAIVPGDDPLIVLNFRFHKLGPKISSADIMLSLVSGKYDS